LATDVHIFSKGPGGGERDTTTFMANTLNTPRLDPGRLELLPQSSFEPSLWESLTGNLREIFFPEKLPPLQLTSRPVKVRDIWGGDSYKKQGAWLSLAVHALAVAASSA